MLIVEIGIERHLRIQFFFVSQRHFAEYRRLIAFIGPHFSPKGKQG
jgi:hypothetical protein